MMNSKTQQNGQSVMVKDLVKQFGTFTAVNRISFSVNRGEIFGLLGPNGAGKSTTIRMLCGILSAAVTGTLIPLGCDRVGVDPALASGPFVTSMNDITGTLIYLGLGARLLVFFGH